MEYEKVIRIHNPIMALPGFGFEGIQAYSTRSMTDHGGITIVDDCGDPASLRGAHQYYRNLGLGPEEIILVKTLEDSDLYGAISENKILRTKIVKLVKKENYKIEFFCTRNEIEENFINELGLKWSDVVSHPSILADTYNDKAKLRINSRAAGINNLFPKHHVVSSDGEFIFRGEQMLHDHEEIVIKPPLWSSGVGMIFGNNQSVLDAYKSKHRGVPDNTIIEQSLGANHLSMTIVKRFVNGLSTDEWFSEQICTRENGSIVAEGFILGDFPNVNSEDIKWMKEKTKPLYELILKDYPKLTGIINFDCLRQLDGKDQRYVLECNARITFSTYVQLIRRQLLSEKVFVNCGNEKITKVTCLVNKVKPEKINNFKLLKKALGKTLYSDPGTPGVIPIIIGCLAVSGYCYFVAVADSYKDAAQVMLEARKKIEI